MAVMSGYFDASGTAGDTEVVAVGGVLSSPERWLLFDEQWHESLGAHGVPAMHMKHFAHTIKEFAHMKGDEFARRRFLNGLMWTLEEHIEYSVACAVHMADYRAIDQTYRLSEHFKPYTLASLTCAGAIVEHADMDSTPYGRDDVIYFFEKGNEDEPELRRVWARLIPTLRVEPIFLGKCDSHPPGTPKRRIRQFEASDFVAYENLKANGKLIERENVGATLYVNELRKPIQRMKGLPGAEKWRMLDFPALQRICQSWKIPLR